jgi:hypothetical protein
MMYVSSVKSDGSAEDNVGYRRRRGKTFEVLHIFQVNINVTNNCFQYLEDSTLFTQHCWQGELPLRNALCSVDELTIVKWSFRVKILK